MHLGAAFAVGSFVNGLETGQDITVLAFQTQETEPDKFVAKEVTANAIRCSFAIKTCGHFGLIKGIFKKKEEDISVAMGTDGNL